MFGIKTKIIKRLNSRFTGLGFNEKKISLLESHALNLLAKKELNDDLRFIDLQSPIFKKTNPFAEKIVKTTAAFMPNNLGNWSIKKPYSLTTKLELKLINFIKKKYSCNQEIVGHFGSGSTEGNIYAAWIGRKYLSKKLATKNTDKIAIIKSCLAHYSINKAADIVGVELFETSIKEQEFNLDEDELIIKIENLYRSGVRGFMIPITLGYTVSGTDDDFQKINKLISQFEKKHKDCAFFMWIDAAFSGISKIFITKNFHPFKEKNIQLVTSDFHKFLAVPYPASIMLYRKNLIKLIEKNIPYIDQMDTTLLGSRPGISVLATWLSLVNLSENKIKKELNKSIDQKNKYLRTIESENLNVQVVSNNTSNQACLISKGQSSTKILEDKFQLKSINYNLLFKNRKKTIKLYKLYFLPNFR